ncbi:unnamed protein product [Polarella glacialis]|uniref:Uncharacterized protein n=1 Tax=Polarella glacialis TaxID=89957 RepID=A0A813K855_POLGL|nr:unnamed protein product [Polarella glacialis]
MKTHFVNNAINDETNEKQPATSGDTGSVRSAPPHPDNRVVCVCLCVRAAVVVVVLVLVLVVVYLLLLLLFVCVCARCCFICLLVWAATFLVSRSHGVVSKPRCCKVQIYFILVVVVVVFGVPNSLLV